MKHLSLPTNERFYLYLLFVVIFLNITDSFLTWFMIDTYPDYVYEGNPIVLFVMNHYPQGWWMLKISFIGIACLFLSIHLNLNIVKYLITIITIIYFYLFVYQIGLFYLLMRLQEV